MDALGSVLIENGVIVDVGPGVFVDAMQGDIEVIDCLGCCLAPGLVDIRVQVREPGYEHKETIESVGLSATGSHLWVATV